jgi:uncharacterized membrane protein
MNDAAPPLCTSRRFAGFLRTLTVRYWAKFSFVGLACATLLFAGSLTPSLLPRNFAVQGLLSGFALAVGYGVGEFWVWLYRFLELPTPSARLERTSKWATSAAVALLVVIVLWRATVWQNSLRALMEMPRVETAYPFRVGLIALITAVLLIALARTVGLCWHFVHLQAQAIVPRRVSYVLTTVLIVVALFLLANRVVARLALQAADSIFLEIDKVVDDELAAPSLPTASGGPGSLVPWNTIGRRGKTFVLTGPTQQDIAEFRGQPAKQPLRVYAGMRSHDTFEDRAKLALEELKRVGGFERSLLVVAVPTGTGWLDPGAVDTLEYLHGGDTAIVSMQYSYLPSWITILVDPRRSLDAGQVLFDTIYNHWTTLPKDSRPKLYLHGLSLGALGSAASADLFTVFEDPIQGAVWSGPPFPSTVWSNAVRGRNPGTPVWLPTFRDSSMVRFTGRENSLDMAGRRWGPMRLAYIQHASDPMTFFSTDLLYRRPAWLVGERGPDVSPYLDWRPLLTFLQIAFDLPMATSVPHGYGHNFAAASYIDAWIAVTAPEGWNTEQVRRLKERFRETKAAD